MLVALAFALAAAGPAAAQITVTATPTLVKKAPTAHSTSTAAKPSADPNAIATQIARDPQQKARIQKLLPAGMTIEQASAGFRNQWQLLAALDASQKQNLPFRKLQAALTVEGLSLSEAVRQLKGERSSKRAGA
jgi:hypothetical protein